jgi:hypothetical protein
LRKYRSRKYRSRKYRVRKYRAFVSGAQARVPFECCGTLAHGRRGRCPTP